MSELQDETQGTHTDMISSAREQSCQVCRSVSTLGAEKTIGLKLSEQWVLGTQAKLNRPFYEFETEIDLQIKNGLDMGRILHSNVACSNIVIHISDHLR
ncbi:uncharacterized protein LOC126249444 [Schistocerca nitens]|uniref:uncharacterized protein LOC126249444 n=1 Tax=Schistocerca nitens TaxID=7011 RepID=UPI00211886E5|nr:uncharacterized protein LOC126249444 [Schistocerca nitens]